MPVGREKKKDFHVVLPAEIQRHYEDQKKELGAGGFAKVILAEHVITKQKVAIKVMSKAHLAKKDDLHRAYNEIYALKHLRHQHICQMYEVYEEKDFIYLIIEYCPGGELFDYIVSKKRLAEREARDVFRQIASAVAFIHENGYAHRDLKPENMLLDKDKKIKIIDFGLSAKPERGLTSPLCTRAGSALYASPELISGDAYYGDETDVWSLGVVLYALLCGFLPFDHNNTSELYRKIKKGEFATPPWLSPGSIRLLKAMLEIDTSKRITMQELLQHDWIRNASPEPLKWESDFREDQLNPTVIWILCEYYNWSLLETEAKVKEYNYDHMTALYFLLCSMSDTQLERFRSMWLQHSLSNDSFLTCSASKSNGINDIQFSGSPNQRSRSRSFLNFAHKFSSKPRSKTLDPLENNSATICKTKNEIPTIQLSREETKPRSKTTVGQDCCNGSANFYEIPIDISTKNEIMNIDEKPRSHTVSVFHRKHKNPNVIVSNDTENDETTLPSVVNMNYLTPTGQQSKQKESSRRLWHTADTNLNKTKRMAASCMDGLDQRNFRQEDKCDMGLREEFRSRTNSLKEFTKRLSGLFKHEVKPRRVKAIYHVENTSTHSADEVRAELDRVLTVMVETAVLASYSNPEKYLFRCKSPDEKKTIFELEVCLIPLMDNVVGIRRKRLKGDAWKYKELVEKVLSVAKV